MENLGKLNFSLKKFIQMWIFIIGVVLLVWQCKSTIVTFFSFRTTVAISKETSSELPIPTIVVCQDHKWDNGFFQNDMFNISDKDWILKQFFRLNDKMNISIDIDAPNDFVSLQIGNQPFGEVKELLNPWRGLCYVIIPNQSLPKLGNNYVVYLRIGFSEEIKKFSVSTYFISSEDWPVPILPTFGLRKLFKIPWPGLQTLTWIGLQRRINKQLENYMYLTDSTANCKNYPPEEESYMECMVRSNVECFEETANVPESGCACVPNGTHYSYYDISPMSLDWEECKSNSEFNRCFEIMHYCSYAGTSKCGSPCEYVEYTGDFFDMSGASANTNEIFFVFQFNTMDTEVHSEILTFDLATFIGTAGGSLGLFLGFSLTGFADQVLNFFMRN